MAAKKKSSIPKPLSRNIIRHTNKNGDFYYYNYKQNKITSGDSWQAQNTRIKKRNEEIEEQERKHRQYLKRKREAEKEQEKKHRQYLKRKKSAIKKKKKKIPSPIPPIERSFPKEIEFYQAREVFDEVIFSGIEIIVNISDPINNFTESFTGLPQGFSAWYTSSGTYLHLRKYYSKSPPAIFELVDTDGLTFAEYEINISR